MVVFDEQKHGREQDYLPTMFYIFLYKLDKALRMFGQVLWKNRQTST